MARIKRKQREARRISRDMFRWFLVLVLVGGGCCLEGMDPEMAELAAMVRENCHGETGVDLGLVDQVNAGADLMPDAKLKCYMKCVMETGGFLSEGEVDVDAVLGMLPETFKRNNEANLRACGTQKGVDDCDTAYKTQECWQKKNKKDFFLI